jgi:hypothetical protein
MEKARYLTTRPGAQGRVRYFWQPPTAYVKDGWSALRLFHEYGRPIAALADANKRCVELNEIFDKWQAGTKGYGPHLIDKLGRLTAKATKDMAADPLGMELAPAEALAGRRKLPFFITRKTSSGDYYYFQPNAKDVAHGWVPVPLHDNRGNRLRDAHAALRQAAQVVDVYLKWRRGVPDHGPQMIDNLGRLVSRAAKPPEYLPGQIGAMVADYLAHSMFTVELKPKTQLEYRTYLNLLVREFGTLYWREVAPGAARQWLMKRAEQSGQAGALSLARSARTFFARTRLIYPSVEHPGYVPEGSNPFAKLNLPAPKLRPLPWSHEAVRAFVELADAQGEYSLGDAIVLMSWFGVRKQDWLHWPADIFEGETIAWRQAKTSVANMLPWRLVPELTARVEQARQRRAKMGVVSTSFFTHCDGTPWRDADDFRDTFNRLRDLLAERHESFAVNYYVGLVPGKPLALPTRCLSMRTMRHTCVTFHSDAGARPEEIAAITGHTTQEVELILRHYRARTLAQAEAALKTRLAHERKANS